MHPDNIGIKPNFNINMKTSEECAELIQALAKIDTWGVHGRYDAGQTNIEQLVDEIADVTACLGFLVAKYQLDKYENYIAHRSDEKVQLYFTLEEASR